MKQILETLNALVASLAPSRIDDFGDFHKKVRSAIDEYLNENGLVYSTWYIIPPTGYGDNILSLQIDFTADKRVKHGLKGKLNVISFKLVEPFTVDMTIDEVFTAIKRRKIESEIASLTAFIAEQTKAVDDATNRIAGLKEYLTRIESPQTV